jgi:uncharacterized membrane protein
MEIMLVAKSKSITALAAIVIIIVAAFAIYSGVTYPRTTANIPVSFTIGADTQTAAFDQPFLDDKAQVQVTVQNGAALWRAQILSGDQVIWEHSAAQGEQQSYNSGWIQLPNGSYNFTFGIIGIGSLDATATVTSKGGFW